jgi:alkylation response protein AidB-like acyl-CoA dehydrogenase
LRRSRTPGGEAAGYELDVTDLASQEKMAASVINAWGRIDILVANAGRRRLPDPRRDGCSTEFEIERLYRDAPMLLIGEGTSKIQKMIIGQRLVREYRTSIQ